MISLNANPASSKIDIPAIVVVLHVCTILLMGNAACSRIDPQSTSEIPKEISFNSHVRPILNQHCAACHGGVKKAGGVSFIYKEEALGVSESGNRVVAPGKPASSELYRRIVTLDPDDRMPPPDHGDPLSNTEIEILEKWIREGAPWEEHWAYLKPEQPSIPLVRAVDWPKNNLDRFVLTRLESEGLSPAEEERRTRLYRRLSFDLIGLPPTVEATEAFTLDESPSAYERAVEDLLASPHFGERWATPWLDLARYADTMGYERDPNRQIWAYRDWVIKALNNDMPYDAFTIKQLAGDLLENPTYLDLIATAFHRNSKTNVEGGTDDEEFRTMAVLDRVNTTWQTWMGTTFACVQCHSHPYDPFPHQSYYEFLAYFNNAQDHDTKDDYPTIPIARSHEKQEELATTYRESYDAETEFLKPFQALAEKTNWIPLRYASASTRREDNNQTGNLVIKTDTENGDFLLSGPDNPKGLVHSIQAMVDGPEIEALRIDALMLDEFSNAKPGHPFTVSYLEVAIQFPDGTSSPIDFQYVIADEANQRTWAESSLDKEKKGGWSAYPKQHHDRWAVFILDHRLPIPDGSKLEIRIHNLATHDGAHQPVLRKFRLSTSSDSSWRKLATDADLKGLHAKRANSRKRLDALKETTVPVLSERTNRFARETRVFRRGAWDDKQALVGPGIPPLLQNDSRPPANRLEMARWIVSPDNPLTARVAINRVWEQLFGLGLVESLEDFGSSGLKPSHPELLDYLALRFQSELDWSLKALLREIVLSATYRQAAVITEEKLAIDPRNKLLSRGPRSRLSAEMVRDNALFVSGLLSRNQFGPPVKPYQPEKVWSSVHNNLTWEISEGEDRYRRAIYTFWKRTTPYPSFVIFDAPERELCVPRRIVTNTPLQALVTLNDPVYAECASSFAKLAMTSGESPNQWIAFALKRALQSAPNEENLSALKDLYHDILNTPSESDEPVDPLAAMTVVASTILNLDEFLVK